MKIKRQKYFYPEKPVLMSIEQDAFLQMSEDPKWIAEPKYNGARCLVHIFDGDVSFWDRHGKKLDFDSNPLYKNGRDKIKDILRRAFGVVGYFLFDGELRHNKVTGIQCKLVLWDCFVYNHELLNKKPYWARRSYLEVLITPKLKKDEENIVIVIKQYKDNFKKAYEDYVSGVYGNPDEFEGLVLKNVNGKLNLGTNSGLNSNWMFKIRKQTGRHRF